MSLPLVRVRAPPGRTFGILTIANGKWRVSLPRAPAAQTPKPPGPRSARSARVVYHNYLSAASELAVEAWNDHSPVGIVESMAQQLRTAHWCRTDRSSFCAFLGLLLFETGLSWWGCSRQGGLTGRRVLLPRTNESFDRIDECKRETSRSALLPSIMLYRREKSGN